MRGLFSRSRREHRASPFKNVVTSSLPFHRTPRPSSPFILHFFLLHSPPAEISCRPSADVAGGENCFPVPRSTFTDHGFRRLHHAPPFETRRPPWFLPISSYSNHPPLKSPSSQSHTPEGCLALRETPGPAIPTPHRFPTSCI